MDYSLYWATVEIGVENGRLIGPLLDTGALERDFGKEVADAALSYKTYRCRDNESEAVLRMNTAAAELIKAGIDPDELMNGSKSSTRVEHI